MKFLQKKTTLGIYIRGLTEKDTDMADDRRLHADIKENEALLDFLRVEDRKIQKHNDSVNINHREKPRTLLTNTENSIS